MQKVKAQIVPWSSVVGTGIMLLDEKGKCIGMLGLHGVQIEGTPKDVSMKLIEQVAEQINGKA